MTVSDNMVFKKNDIMSRKIAYRGYERQKELHPNIYSEMGKKSRKYENIVIKSIAKNFDHLFLPNEVCDRIGVIGNKIIFLEVKRNERHSKLTHKQKIFKNIIKKVTNQEYQIIIE